MGITKYLWYGTGTYSVCMRMQTTVNVERFTGLKVFKPGAPGFLVLLLSVNVCVCPPPRLLITSGVMWCDMDPI